MTNLHAHRQYVLFEPWDDLNKIYRLEDLSSLREYINQWLQLKGVNYRVVARPSFDWRLVLSGESVASQPKRLIVAIEFDDIQARDNFRAMAEAAVLQAPDRVRAVGADLSFGSTQTWCPGEASDPLFADRTAALDLIGVPYLRQNGLAGQRVNIVLVDQGLDAGPIANNYAGGWTDDVRIPGQRTGGHGARMARNVLAVAPAARLFDLPLIPDVIGDIDQFLSDADAAFETLLRDIGRLRQQPAWSGPWILVNAWGVFDRQSEHPLGDYTANLDHSFNQLIARAVSENIDVVFSAGNCGQFCPDPRCGTADRGPGHSIWGANAHPRVISTGAVRTDTLWLGYSSQGPTQMQSGQKKPDLCAPSQFRDPLDAHAGNTGTSAACALTAGAIALLRSRWDQEVLPPDALSALLRDSARKTETQGWDSRFGHGVLDAKEAFDRLERQQR